MQVSNENKREHTEQLYQRKLQPTKLYPISFREEVKTTQSNPKTIHTSIYENDRKKRRED